MRQVPHYLIIGNGRVATQMACYLTQLQLPFSRWYRPQPLESLRSVTTQATHILLLLSDQAIETFANQHLRNSTAYLIHFSGSVVSDRVIGAHPLMTFSNETYELAQYQSIPFIIDHHAPPFEELLPGLPNPHARLHTSQKAKYHALCVMSGNFSCLLWQKLMQGLQEEFKMPAEFAFPYLKQQTQNLLTHAASALTGPLVRGDSETIAKNQAALSGDPFQSVYESFVTCYEQLKREGQR